MRGTSRVLLLATALACAAGRVALAAPPEARYLEEEDEAKAAALLPDLLAKHDTPKEVADLVKALRNRKPRGDLKKDRDTFDWPCPDGKTRQFTYILPPKHSPGKRAGVMVWLHGAVRQPAPGGGAGEAAMFRPAVEDLGCIVVGPSTYEGVEWGAPGCRALVHHALRVVKTSFAVDENRVYLCGDSDGGRGAFRVAETEATTIAAAVAVIGSPGGVTRFVNLRNLPWLAVNGDRDTIFEIGHVREAMDGMKAAGFDLTWKVIAGGGHDPRFFLTYAGEVREFLGKHPRDPLPKKVEWSVDPADGEAASRFPANTFRWIRIEEAGEARRSSPFDDAGIVRGGLPRVEAVRDGNRFVVRTSGVRRVTLLLSDAMVDLARDVEVVVNDVVLFRGRAEPDARVVLEEGRRFLDRSLVFSARITLDVDAEPVAPGPAEAPPSGR